MGWKTRPHVQRLLLVGLGIVVALGLGEGIVRLLGVARPAELGPLFDRPPVFFRSQHRYTRQQMKNWFRIAVIGDSFTVGSGNQSDDAYPARLERLLNLNLEIVPAKVQTYAEPGLSTAEQLKFLRLALRIKPDLIVLGMFLNDTEEHGDELVRLREPLLPRIPKGWMLVATSHSHLLRLAYERFETARSQRAAIEYYRQIYDPEYSGWIRFRMALDEFKRRCDKAEVPLLAMVFPGIFQLEASKYPFRHQHERLRWALEEAGIPYFDLLDSFLGRSELRLAAHPGIDGHPNEIGHRIAAEALLNHLLESGLIDASYRPRVGVAVSREKSLREVRRRRSPVAWAKEEKEKAE